VGGDREYGGVAVKKEGSEVTDGGDGEKKREVSFLPPTQGFDQ